MSCNGNCAACPIQCGASTLSKLEANKKESREMSEAVSGCHAGNEEKIGRLDERSQFATERNNVSKTIAIVALVLALISLFIAWTALRDNAATQKELSEFKANTERIIEKADDAERAYTNARKSLERARDEFRNAK